MNIDLYTIGASNVQTSKEWIYADDDFIHEDSDEEDETMIQYSNIDEEKN